MRGKKVAHPILSEIFCGLSEIFKTSAESSQTPAPMSLLAALLAVALPLAAAAAAAPSSYVDPIPLNTTACLDSIRHLPLSTYRLAHDPDRLRIGVPPSPDVAAALPEAVDILPVQVLPPRTRGGERTILRDVPIVNEQTIFLTGVGATQELIAVLSSLDDLLGDQIDRVSALVGQVELLEELLTSPSTRDGKEELRMRAAATAAVIAKAEMELEVARARDEEEYIRATHEAELAQLKRSEELTLQRLAREDEAARVRAEESMKRKLEAAQRVEQARAESAEALSKIEHERALLVQRAAEEAKVKTARSIAAAKAQAERENEGLYLRRLKAQMEQARQKNLAIVHALAGHFASSMTWAAQNPRQVFVGYLSLIFAAIFAAREAARLGRILLEASIGKPRLVRETSCASLPRSVMSSMISLCWRRSNGDEQMEEIFQDVVLSDPLKDRVVALAKAARNAKRHDAPYRHVLLYGPPGTGKTMVAKKLAQSTGMDFALMSGGDVGPLGSDAVTQIHSLFRWAKMSRKGLLLFVDEAEAFLGNRKQSKMSENAHNALNALLYHTGGERRDFLLVLATNRAEDLDEAVLDRCDESLLFGLPDAECRQKLTVQYYEAFVKGEVVKNDEQASSLGSHLRSYLTKEDPFRVRIDDDVMDQEQLGAVVAATEGFSGREIGKLMNPLPRSRWTSIRRSTAWRLAMM